MIVVTVGDLVLPLTCKRCGHREAMIVGDDASEAQAITAMQAHVCNPKERKEPS